jgi:hypothetical protein
VGIGGGEHLEVAAALNMGSADLAQLGGLEGIALGAAERGQRRGRRKAGEEGRTDYCQGAGGVKTKAWASRKTFLPPLTE